MAHITTLTRAYNDLHNSQANTYSYSGSFETFKESEVRVKLNSTDLTYNSSPSDNTQYSVNLTDKTIHVGGGNLTSGTLSIFPVTDLGAPTLKAPYTAGSAITASDITNNQLQVMRRQMEFDADKLDNTGGTMTGNLTMGEDTTIIFEGATNDAHETTLTVADPTADRTITLPNVTGTVVTTGDTGSVSTGMIADNAVTGAKFADNSVTMAKLAGGTLPTDITVASANITDLTVATADIATDAVTGAKIADDSINSEHYVDGSIDTAHIADSQVTEAKLADTNVTTAKIANTAVTDAKLASNAVTTSKITDLNVTTDKLAADSVTIAKIGCEQTTISDSDSHLPTSGAVVDYVAAQLEPFGGFEAIANEVSFPNTQPASGVAISIADAAGIVVSGSGSSTTGRTVGGTTVTINNIPSNFHSSTIATGIRFIVTSTGSGQIYNYHKATLPESDLVSLSGDINDFNERYRVGSSNPSSNNDTGDLFFNTSTGKMLVFNGTSSSFEEVQSIGNFFISTFAEAFDGSRIDFTLSNAPTSAQQIILSINGVIQKPNAGTGRPSEGFSLNSATVQLPTGSAPASGTDYFAIVMGSTVNIGTPSDGTVTAAKLTSGAVETAKIADDAVTDAKLANSINTAIAANTAKTTNATHTGDVTGSTTLTIANDVVGPDELADTSVSAGSYGSATAIPAITVDAQGRITAASTNAINTSTIPVADESSDTTCFPVFVTTATGDQAPKTGSNLTFNSATGALGATSYTGDGSNLTGVASAVADGCIYENSQTISNNYTISTNKNALSAGPITIANGVTLTIPSGSVYTIV